MPAIIRMNFPGGRYHATPWGRHVNEGVPEWPPSPWRLLRALIAVWQRTCRDVPEDRVRRVLERLLEPPLFMLPRHTVAHTRHYVPWEKKGPADRTLIFDTFVAVQRQEPILIGWPDVEFAGDDRATLAALLGNLTWLGRAEGWVNAQLTDETVAWTCCPADANDPNPVPVLCPEPQAAFADDHYPVHSASAVRRGLRPGDLLFDCPRWHLCLDTQTMHAEGWPSIPGAKWVNYTRPAEARNASRTIRRPALVPTTARYALDGPVLPLIRDTIRVAEAVRRALMSRYRKHKEFQKYGQVNLPDAERFASAVFSGKDERGDRLRDDHLHAFYLPTDEDGDGRIDHLTVHAQRGFDLDEIHAIDGLRRVTCGDLELSLLLVGLGDREAFRGSTLVAASTTWVSATPFLVTRHIKRRGRKRDPKQFLETAEGRGEFVKQVLREELERRGLFQDGTEIEAIASTPGHPSLRPIEFRLNRDRKSGDDSASRPRGLFRIRFPQPVTGPIALGHSCHFGLGLFLATSR